MMNEFQSVMFFMLSLLATSTLNANELSKWYLVNKVQGVSVYRMKETPQENLLSVRVEGIISAPPEKVLWAINDLKNLSHWVIGLKSAQVYKIIGRNQFVMHNQFHFPFPFADRDSIVKVHYYQDQSQGSIRMEAESWYHQNLPKASGIRSYLHRGTTIVSPVGGGGMTNLVFETLVDLKGWIPHWLLNFLQKHYAAKSIILLRQYLKQENTDQYPSFRKFPFYRFPGEK